MQCPPTPLSPVFDMFVTVVLLSSMLVPVARAANATIFPVGLGPDASLKGEIVGSGGDVGTTYVLSGETSDVSFTLTLAEDASLIAEHVSIPTLSFDLNVGCVVSAGSAVCMNVLGSGTTATTLALTTRPFSPFDVPVSTGGGLTSTRHSSASTSNSTRHSVASTITSGSGSASVSATATATSSVGSSSVALSIRSTGPVSTAGLATPGAVGPTTSDGSRLRIPYPGFLLSAFAALCVLSHL